ncbi:type I-E CRISPR-associated protein Cse2/CasB [Streptomyces sp. NPDC012888]|uniref:type I-E CRISPR-associated protein Cse2/CasB n=1 Tax=Streptomyces sp. NPDC012888 TaxID=3364855 RepID=UPI003678CD9B
MTETAPLAPAPATSPPRQPQPANGGTSGRRERGLVGEAVAQRIRVLQHEYQNDQPHAVQTLARLRRGIGRQANETPDLWGLVGMESFYASQPAGRRLQESEILRAERAAHVAMTLWALHQQSNRSKRMHVADGASLGGAVRRLMPDADGGADNPVRKRLLRAGTATTFDVLAQRLRELVVLLRAAEIPLDYGLLADHLDQWQRPGGAGAVRQAWGRGFHAYRPATGAGDGRSDATRRPGGDTGGDTDVAVVDAAANDTKDYS